MPQIFLSYRSTQRFWMESFRNTALIEQELKAKSGGNIFDYSIDPTTQGLFRDDMDSNIKKCDVFIAVVDEKYQTSKDTLREFDTAYLQFFRNGRPVPHKAFAHLCRSKGARLVRQDQERFSPPFSGRLCVSSYVRPRRDALSL